MAKLKMQKIEIIAMLSDSKKIVERLQRRGVVELADIEDENLTKIAVNTSINNFEKSLAVAKSALEGIQKYVPQQNSLLSSLNGRVAVSTDEFANRVKNTSSTLHTCYEVSKNIRKINENANNVSKINIRIDYLSQWLRLDVAQNYKGTSDTAVFVGSLSGELSEQDIALKFNEIDKDLNPYIEIIDSLKEQTNIFVMCHKADRNAIYQALNEMNFVNYQSKSEMTPTDEIKSLEAELKSINDENSSLIKSVESCNSIIKDIEFLCDFLVMRIDKYKAIQKFSITKNTVVITGYIPQKYVDGLMGEFEKKYDIAINIFEPNADDDVPVMLQNGKFSEPVEGITEMYALPNKRDVDPSSVMAFFYYLFFGMMLSDAGYGVLMIIGTTLALTKFSVEGKLKRSLKMFQYCGISTLIWGALFGSWFGDLPQTIASNFFGITINTTALWFEPLDNPIKLLLFSFLLGICHLFLGLAVNFKIIWKEGHKLDAICEVVPVYITIIGVAPLAASILTKVPPVLSSIGMYLLIIGAISILLTAGRSSKNIIMRFFGGIYGLYNIATGYLSDILSYSRLLALGLATGSIASVINLIATMPSNTALKAVMLIVVGIVGHAANLGINLLGAYVHSDRLQFVELFSKFYEGGGRAFKPLNVNTKYIKFKKENIYE